MRASSPPSGFSILITSAPMSAMITPASGPASAWPTSMTRTPSNGKVTVDPSTGEGSTLLRHQKRREPNQVIAIRSAR